MKEISTKKTYHAIPTDIFNNNISFDNPIDQKVQNSNR